MDAQLIKDLGLPVTIVLACGLFFWKGFWPWMTSQVAFAQQQASTYQKQTTEAVSAVAGLKETLSQQVEMNREIISILRGISKRQ